MSKACARRGLYGFQYQDMGERELVTPGRQYRHHGGRPIPEQAFDLVAAELIWQGCEHAQSRGLRFTSDARMTGTLSRTGPCRDRGPIAAARREWGKSQDERQQKKNSAFHPRFLLVACLRLR